MEKSCRQCTAQFDIADEDITFYDKVSPVFNGKKYPIPAPTFCPDCRAQRRLAFRNERKLYHRKCDLSGKDIISIFSSDKMNKVFLQGEWWSDKWDPIEYGRDYDFSRSFFEQYDELLTEVPHMNLIGENNENSDYCNLVANCRNCYLVFESSNNEDCFYGYWLQKCNDCCDVSYSHDSRFCYECDNCYKSHSLLWSRNCINCVDSAFLYDCIGCKNCLFCANLRQKEYCIFNKQYTKEEYLKLVGKYLDGSYSAAQSAIQEFENFLLTQQRRFAYFVNTENCTGDYIVESKNCIDCYHAHQAEDCKYGEHVWRDSKNNMDVSTVGRGAELVYEAINTGIGASHDLFTIQCWSGTSDLIYCYECFSSENCFGCSGLRHHKYCILNKQYTKEEYEELVPRIIEHMTSSGEWGEFFPAGLSLFGYNETVANEQFPLLQSEAMNFNAKWREEDIPKQNEGQKVEIPDNIKDVSDDILGQILICDKCMKNYKIIPQELEYYRRFNLPVPRNCPDCRHEHRLELRNPNKLWGRKCDKCMTDIQTTYAQERSEKVYCEKCYLEEVY